MLYFNLIILTKGKNNMKISDLVKHKTLKGTFYIRLKKKASNQCLIADYPFSTEHIKCSANDLILIEGIKA